MGDSDQKNAQLQKALRARLGDERLRSVPYSPVQRSFYSRIPDTPSGSPQTVIEVESATEIAEILGVANDLRTPIYVRQGTGAVTIDLLNPFPEGCVILDLRRLNHFSVRRHAGLVELGPAITLREANKRLAQFGYRFPISVEPATWGGLASVNLSGHLVDAASGKPGDYVQGLQVVLPTGSIIQTGTKSMRKTVGPDLTRLFIGNQGLMGVITELTLRLVPAPGGQAFGWAVFADVEDLIRTVQDIYFERLPMPSILEFIDSSFARVSGLASFLPEGHVLLVATDGTRPEDAGWKLQRLTALAANNGATTATVDEPEWQVLWQIRMSPHLHMAGQYLVGDVVDAPLDRLGAAVRSLNELRTEAQAKWAGLSGHLWGHIGSGTIHPAYACPPIWPYLQRAKVAKWLRDRILDVRLRVGGSVGEQGIFPQHVEWYSQAYGKESLELLRSLKRTVDPNDILSPERLIGRVAAPADDVVAP